MSTYSLRQVIVVVVVAAMAPTAFGQLFEDFDGNGNTTYHFSGSSDMTEGSNTFVQLSDSDGANNALSFDEESTVTGPAPNGKILSFDFRMSLEGLRGTFDGGMGAGYFAAGPWGLEGPRNPGAEDADTDWEEPSFAGAATLGFRPNLNTISLNAFEILLNEETAPFPLASGEFHRAILTVTPDPADTTKALFDVDLIQDVNGAGVGYNLMTDVAANINLSALPRNRVMAGARAVGGALTADVDNFSVNFIPEPGSALLLAFASIGVSLLASRQRRIW